MKINEIIRTRRLELEMSQRGLAEMVGCRPHFISQLESGSVAFPKKKWRLYARSLKIDETSFLMLVFRTVLVDVDDYVLVRYED